MKISLRSFKSQANLLFYKAYDMSSLMSNMSNFEIIPLGKTPGVFVNAFVIIGGAKFEYKQMISKKGFFLSESLVVSISDSLIFYE